MVAKNTGEKGFSILECACASNSLQLRARSRDSWCQLQLKHTQPLQRYGLNATWAQLQQGNSKRPTKGHVPKFMSLDLSGDFTKA